MNQLMLYPEDQRDSHRYCILPGLRLTHLQEVLRSSVGDLLRVALLNEGRSEATITELNDRGCWLDVSAPWVKTAAILPEIHLQVGVSRPPSMKKILEYATGMGVTRYHWIQTELSDRCYWTSKILRPEIYTPLMDAGLAQSNFYFTRPTLECHKSGRLEDWPKDEGSQKFLLDPASDKNWGDYQLDRSRPITLAIGPERGFTKKEERYLKEQKYLPLQISQTLLRVEMAVFYALAQIEYELVQKSKKSC